METGSALRNRFARFALIALLTQCQTGRFARAGVGDAFAVRRTVLHEDIAGFTKLVPAIRQDRHVWVNVVLVVLVVEVVEVVSRKVCGHVRIDKLAFGRTTPNHNDKRKEDALQLSSFNTAKYAADSHTHAIHETARYSVAPPMATNTLFVTQTASNTR